MIAGATLVLLFAAALLGGAGSLAAITPSAPILASVPAGGYPDAFPYGQCTWWAAYNHPVTWGGDARDWFANASDAGMATSAVPSVGAIVAYRPGGLYSELGHVAIVIAVSERSYRVSEMHAPQWGVVSEREIAWPDPHVLGFIPAGEPSRR
jgi:surface antigen